VPLVFSKSLLQLRTIVRLNATITTTKNAFNNGSSIKTLAPSAAKELESTRATRAVKFRCLKDKRETLLSLSHPLWAKF